LLGRKAKKNKNLLEKYKSNTKDGSIRIFVMIVKEEFKKEEEKNKKNQNGSESIEIYKYGKKKKR